MTSPGRRLYCQACGHACAIGPWFSGCPVCRQRQRVSVLEVEYEDDWPDAAPFGRGAAGRLWSYRARLPLADAESELSLGEGLTPLVPSRHAGSQLGLERLYFKNETANPTQSFKDRYAAVAVSMALALGFKKIVVSSTGNHGAAVAAYAARGGLTCVVLCARHTPPPIIEQIRRHGALPVRIDGPDRFRLVEHLALQRSWYPAALFLEAPVQNPYGVEGYKTIAYELVAELGDVPDVVVFPCARGNGLYGTWKGFRELRAAGVVERLPRVIAVQPETANTIERSLHAGSMVRMPPAMSIAASITEEVAGEHAVQAITASLGAAVSVPDGALEAAVRSLAAEGVWVEPSSAAPLAALGVLLERGAIRKSDSVVLLLTGSGAKWSTPPGPGPLEVDRIHGRADELEQCLSRHGIDP